MRQILLELDKSNPRPVVLLKDDLTALLDTGAFVPVWVAKEEDLRAIQGVRFVKADVPFSGFGGTTRGNLYRMTLQVGNMVYPDMPILANAEVDSDFDMILSAPMFDGLIYQVDTVNHVLNIDIPDNESNVRHIRLKNSKGELFVLSGVDEDTDIAEMEKEIAQMLKANGAETMGSKNYHLSKKIVRVTEGFTTHFSGRSEPFAWIDFWAVVKGSVYALKLGYKSDVVELFGTGIGFTVREEEDDGEDAIGVLVSILREVEAKCEKKEDKAYVNRVIGCEQIFRDRWSDIVK